MDKQVRLSGLGDELAQVRLKNKEFLSPIERIVPWGAWLTLIRPCYYKGERGNKPYDLERMNKSEGQITKLVYRGKQSLKAILEQEGFTYADE